ncbi:MAG: hypothetical protein ACJ8F7_01875 [Gemmataceae bacterium]
MTKRRLAITLLVFTISTVVAMTIFYVAHLKFASPRYDALEPLIRSQAGFDTFKEKAQSHQIPFNEEQVTGSWGRHVFVPLDGAMQGKRLKLHFFDDGGLQWAGVVDEKGECVEFFLAVDRFPPGWGQQKPPR